MNAQSLRLGRIGATGPRWRDVYRQLPLAAILEPLNPAEKDDYYLVTCPGCGGRRAYIYKEGHVIRCNRANDCGYEKRLGDWIWEWLLPHRGWTRSKMADYLKSLAGDGTRITAGVPRSVEDDAGDRVTVDVEVNETLMGLCPLEEEGIRWLETRRGIRGETARSAGMGFVGDPADVVEALTKQFGTERLLACGVLGRFAAPRGQTVPGAPWMAAEGEDRKGRPYFRFRFTNHPLLFAYSVGGKVVYITGRTVKDLSAGRKKELHIGGKIPAPWGIDLLPECAHVHICEGGVDALTLLDMGYHAISVPGTGHWKSEFSSLLNLKAVHTVTLAFDPDPAGQKPMLRLIAELNGQGFMVYHLVLPMGRKGKELIKLDVNDWFGKRHWRKRVGDPSADAVAQWEPQRLHVCIEEPAGLALREMGMNVLSFQTFEDAEKGLVRQRFECLDIALVLRGEKKQLALAEHLAGELLKRDMIVRKVMVPEKLDLRAWLGRFKSKVQEART